MAGTRAPNGESPIYQDKAGRWHGYVSMGRKRDGVRDRRHVSGARRAEVVRKVRTLERKRDEGLAAVAGKAPTVEAWLTHWLETIAARRVRTKTLEGSYRPAVENRLVPAIGHHRLDRLQPEHVEALYAELEDEGLAPATVLQIHRILSRALRVAVQRGRVSRNVCVLVDAPHLRRKEVQPFTADDARKILDAAPGGRNAARWSVALALGLRQGEALGLRWPDIDIDAATITVRGGLQRQRWRHGCGGTCGRRPSGCPDRHGGGLRTVPPKSEAGRRTIAVPGPLVEALRRHRAEQVAERLAAGDLWDDHGLVFCQATGKPIDPTADYRAWQALLRTAGVRRGRLHDARHTAATLLLQQGVPARVVMQILGHSQISLTLGTYSHVVPELAHEAAERMGNALWGAPEALGNASGAPNGHHDGTIRKLR